MRRVTSICLVFFIVLTLLTGTAFAAPEFTGNTDPEDPDVVMLIDGDSGELLYTNAHENDKVWPASTTKIMTCILALENGNLSDKVTVSGNAAGQGGQSLDIVAGEEIVLEDLLSAMMVFSGNDAATAVAEHIAVSVEEFVTMMNSKAQELGMSSTQFANASGLQDDNHFVTGSDMAKLAQYAMKNETFRKMASHVKYTIPKTNKRPEKIYENTNHLLRQDKYPDEYYEYATGVKTGDTPLAGRCLVASASKNDMNLICLIFGDVGKEDRWRLSEELFEWGFENFQTVDLASLLKNTEPVQTQLEGYELNDSGDGLLAFKKPEVGSLYVTLEKSYAQALLNGTDTLEPVPAFDKELPLKAPVNEGDILGTVAYKSKATGETIHIDNLIAARNVFEEGSTGGTAVATMTPAPTSGNDKETKDNQTLTILIIVGISGALIVFLIIRMMTVSRNKRFKKRRRPHYSYRIK